MCPSSPVPPQTGDAPIAVDVQNEFISGGSLAAPAGDAVVPAINRYIEAFAARAQRGVRQTGARTLRYADLAP
jgi:hypothetical protein